MSGALLVAGTTSDAGKSVMTAGICRWLARAGVRVAPYKAQNMSNNSAVTLDGGEIGRAQAMQAAACGVEPESAMNPVLLKPGSDRVSHVVVMGRPAGEVGAVGYRSRQPRLLSVALEALADLRSRFDVVVCEGAGSPAEINLRATDIANMGLARAASLPVIVVGDIDRGGVFASMFGTVALLSREDQALVAGFVVNKFRGDARLLSPGLEQLSALTGRPVFGVVPYADGPALDVEDSLGLSSVVSGVPPVGDDVLRVAVVRLPRVSNFTDVDALATEPGVVVRWVDAAAEVVDADLCIVPGTRATVADLAWLRSRGIDVALAHRAAAGAPVFGICGGFQMFGGSIVDAVESRAGSLAGLGLLPVRTEFADAKVLARPHGVVPGFGGCAVSAYEIHHGIVSVAGGSPLVMTDAGAEGCRVGAVTGTLWHGLFENDEFRRSYLSYVAGVCGKRWLPGAVSFADIRRERLDRLGDLVADHLDTDALWRLIEKGAPDGLPFVPPGAPAQ